MNRRSVCLRNRIPWLSQFLRMMKIALVFVFLSVSSLFASVNAQRVSIELKNVSLREIFEQVKKQTGMSFMYSNDDIRHLQKRDFKMTDADVETIMEACLKDTGLTFEVVDEVVIVKPAVQVMNSVPQKKMVLSGTVKDNRGDVMPGVTVRIKGTTLGVATDIDGKWNLEIPEMNDVVLVFSFVGMESQEIEPGNRTVIDVVMEVAKENLEEVVVTGIFTFYLLKYTDVSLTMRIPFWGGHYLNLGWLAVPVLFFAVIGTVNGVNFTDGVDGLATSVTLIVAVFFTVVSIGTQSGIEPVTCAVIGGLMGFLLYNVYPASVFMGDTGSLALGGFVAGVAYMLQMPLFILIVGLIYLVEVLSVMIQVTYFKATHGKRIFKMAPIHHHFELCGWSEARVVAVFTIVTAIMCLIGLLAL